MAKKKGGAGCLVFVGVIMAVALISGIAQGEVFSHTHDWQDATCTAPKTCLLCGETEGIKLDHTLKNVPCGESGICEVCGNEALSRERHDWQEASCAEPEHCLKCGAVNGEPLEHEWNSVICTDYKFCRECGAQGAAATEHQYAEATCDEAAVCIVCGQEYGYPLGHNWTFTSCGAPIACSTCGLEDTEPLGHAFAENDTAVQRRCITCGCLTEHYYSKRDDGTEKLLLWTQYPVDGSNPISCYVRNTPTWVYWEGGRGEELENSDQHCDAGAPDAYCVDGKVYYHVSGYEFPENFEDTLALIAYKYVSFEYYWWMENNNSTLSLITSDYDFKGSICVAWDIHQNPYAIIEKYSFDGKPGDVYAERLYVTLTKSA